MLQARDAWRQAATQKHPPSLVLAMSLAFELWMTSKTHEEWNKIKGMCLNQNVYIAIRQDDLSNIYDRLKSSEHYKKLTLYSMIAIDLQI